MNKLVSPCLFKVFNIIIAVPSWSTRGHFCYQLLHKWCITEWGHILCGVIFDWYDGYCKFASLHLNVITQKAMLCLGRAWIVRILYTIINNKHIWKVSEDMDVMKRPLFSHWGRLCSTTLHSIFCGKSLNFTLQNKIDLLWKCFVGVGLVHCSNLWLVLNLTLPFQLRRFVGAGPSIENV